MSYDCNNHIRVHTHRDIILNVYVRLNSRVFYKILRSLLYMWQYKMLYQKYHVLNQEVLNPEPKGNFPIKDFSKIEGIFL